MKVFETEGIILKSQSLAEADKIVTVLTRAEGVVRLSVRGAKRLKNRFGGRLELFTLADFVYSRKEESELGRLFGLETIESVFHLSNKIAALHVLSYFSELLARIVPPHEPNEVLYRMARTSFAAAAPIADDAAALAFLISYFEIWLLRLTGFLPDFKSCARCQNRLRAAAAFYSALENQVFCADCALENPHGKLLDANFFQLVRTAFVLPPGEFVESARESRVERGAVINLTHRLFGKVLDYHPQFWNQEFELLDALAAACSQPAAAAIAFEPRYSPQNPPQNS